MPRQPGGIDPTIETTAVDVTAGEATKARAGRAGRPVAEVPPCSHTWARGHDVTGAAILYCPSCGAARPR